MNSRQAKAEAAELEPRPLYPIPSPSSFGEITDEIYLSTIIMLESIIQVKKRRMRTQKYSQADVEHGDVSGVRSDVYHKNGVERRHFPTANDGKLKGSEIIISENNFPTYHAVRTEGSKVTADAGNELSEGSAGETECRIVSTESIIDAHLK